MPQLKLIHSGPIYRNPNPGYQHITALFSHVVQIGDQELLCTYNRGQAMYATDLTFWQARSTDGGQTWSDHSPITDRSHDDSYYSYHGPFVSRMGNGLLVIVAFRVDRSDPERPIFNEITGGLTALDVILQRSSDNGRSWSPPEIIAIAEGLVITPSCGIVELADGTWFLTYDQWHGFDEPGPYRPRTVAFFSTDQGHTWGNRVTFADGAEVGKGFWHGRMMPMVDGRLFTLFWSADMSQNVRDLPLHRSFGAADGRNWTFPEATNLPGQTNNAVDLGDGLMVAIYTSRTGLQPGFRVALSTDNGLTWDLDNQLLLWDATGRDRLGIHAPESYPRSHDTIAFGAPTALRLLDGDIFVSFWCNEMSITHIRCARLRVSE